MKKNDLSSHTLKIEFDHIFILILSSSKNKQIDLNHFKKLIYLVIKRIESEDFYYNEEILHDLIYLISHDKYQRFDELLEFCIQDKTLIQNENMFSIEIEQIDDILKIILNEIKSDKKILTIVNDFCNKTIKEINSQLVELLLNEEKDEFDFAYKIASEKKGVKEKEVGEAVHLFNKNSRTCIITIHGFSSAPKEVEELAIFLNNKNLNVYAPRLAGHGTIAQDLENILWQDWYKSICRAITIASLKYKKVYVLGFSTGGLLTLLSAKKSIASLGGIICINAALNLNDIRVKTLLPLLSFWNELVIAFNEHEYAKEYVENDAEYPNINYDRFYIKAIKQLNLLMDETKKNLEKINYPILIIQSKKDPVVNPSSAYEIYEKIKSKNKTLEFIDSLEHVIIKGESSINVYNKIFKFINKNN